jgi:hypothetical protein
VRLLPYTKRSIKLGVVSAVLFVLTVFASEWAWTQSNVGSDSDAGTHAALAFLTMLVIGFLALVSLGCAIFFAIASQANRWK